MAREPKTKEDTVKEETTAAAAASAGAVATQEKQATDVAAKSSGGVPSAFDASIPDYMREQLETDAGKGISTDQADNIIPLLYVLQTNSPQVNKRNEAYIEGAEPGDIWLRSAPSPIVKGQDGFLFQPCHFYKDIVEWVPRDDGGGYVGRYADFPKDTIVTEDEENPNLKYYSLPNGNELKETRYHTGYTMTAAGLVMPYVIPMTGTGHSVSRQFMFMMNSKMTADNKRIPSFACLYRFRTKFRKNKKGEFFVLDVKDEGFVRSAAEYQRGKELYEAMMSGDKVIDDQLEAAAKGDAAGTEKGDGKF